MLASDLLAVIAWAASILVVGSGVGKLRRPAAASRALASAGLPAGVWAVRTVAIGEVGVGAWFALQPNAVSGASLAALYVAFALFLMVLLQRPAEAASCGCLVARDAPPSVLHVVLNLMAAGAAVGVAFRAALGTPTPGLVTQAIRLGWAGVPFAVGLLLAAWLAMLVVAYLPSLAGSFERGAA